MFLLVHMKYGRKKKKEKRKLGGKQSDPTEESQNLQLLINIPNKEECL